MFGLLNSIYNYGKLFFHLYRMNKELPDVSIKNIDILLNRINRCGAVCIKFSQWILPFIDNYYIKDDEKPRWFIHFEKIYDKCLTHSEEYSKKIYNDDFLKDNKNGIEFDEKYEILELIASGSIGQVYKIRKLITNEVYAMKVVHPEVRSQIKHFQILLKIIYWFPYICNYLKKNLPIDLRGFIDEFHIQTNMINEANNMCEFYNSYKDCEKYIIPLTIAFSKNILIMEYNEGIKFDEMEIDEYTQKKIISYLILHGKNNERLNLIHGDIHRGNWSVRDNNNRNYSILVYDFGITLSFKYSDRHIFETCTKLFQNQDETCSDLDPLVDFTLYFMNFEESERETIKEYYIQIKNKDNQILKLDPKKFFVILLDLAKITDNYLNISSLRLIILLIQMYKYYEKYYRPDGKDVLKDVFRNRLTENYTICKTENICPYYMKYLENELNKKNEKIDELFSLTSPDITNNLDLLREIKKNI